MDVCKVPMSVPGTGWMFDSLLLWVTHLEPEASTLSWIPKLQPWLYTVLTCLEPYLPPGNGVCWKSVFCSFSLFCSFWVFCSFCTPGLIFVQPLLLYLLGLLRLCPNFLSSQPEGFPNVFWSWSWWERQEQVTVLIKTVTKALGLSAESSPNWT